MPRGENAQKRLKFRENTFQEGAEQISARKHGSKGWFMLSALSEDVFPHKRGEFFSRVQLKLCSRKFLFYIFRRLAEIHTGISSISQPRLRLAFSVCTPILWKGLPQYLKDSNKFFYRGYCKLVVSCFCSIVHLLSTFFQEIKIMVSSFFLFFFMFFVFLA